ncbi:MAG TPA: phosphate ABC transporter permease subunit PstC [Solirubrobacterales bacterium]|nr:phosphate ABC transporter permease subunit PstC [Solirubrobacterales bacterium]
MHSTTEASAIPGPAPRRTLGVARRRYGELVIQGLLFAAALLSVAITVGIVISLVGPTIDFFSEVPAGDFFFGTDWAPTFTPASFGVIPIVVGTLMVTFWAMVFAIPFGLGAAIWMSEYAKPRQRRVVKPVLEVLEGIPTVAYGFFGIVFVLPALVDVWEAIPILPGTPNPVSMVLAAGVILGIMIIPTVASIAEDSMSAVPRGLREAAYGLGSNKLQVSTRVVVPAALSGIIAGFVLGFSRAIGETIVVLLVAGLIPNLTINPLEPMMTMTAFIATTGSGDIATGSITYKTIFAVGAVLFVMTFLINMVSIRLVRKYRQVYD